jgi:hypothetical protein
MEKYKEQLGDLGVAVDEALLDWVVDAVGPANYQDDARTVACSDKSELESVYSGFVADELKETDHEQGMDAIESVCEEMNGINQKYRAVFYYLLAKHYGK